jgi:hypothetical protein
VQELEVREQAAEVGRGDGGGPFDAQMAFDLAIIAAGAGEDLVQLRHQPHEARQELFAGGGEGEAAGGAHDELLAHAFFELRDALGDD